MQKKKLTEIQMLAAEIYGYSYKNYVDHLAVENLRYTKLMPQAVKQLRQAITEKWSKQKIAEALEIESDQVDSYVTAYQDAMTIVFAENASESFRESVRQSIQKALAKGLSSDEQIDDLVVQICYRAADFGYLLDGEEKRLSDYSDWLTRENGVDYSAVDLPNLK